MFQRIFLVVRGRPEISARKIVPPGTQSAIRVPRVPFRYPECHSGTQSDITHSFTLVPRVTTYTTNDCWHLNVHKQDKLLFFII